MKNGIAQLIKIELSTGTVFLSDGGFLVYAGDTYVSKDSVIGSIASVDTLEAGFGGSISAVDISFNGSGPAATAALSEAALRNRPIELIVAEYNPATGGIVGTPEVKFKGQVDQSTKRLGEQTVGVSCTSLAEPIFSKNAGNALTNQLQQEISAGDTGLTQTTGLGKQWAWGTASVGGTGAGSPGGGPGSFNGTDAFDPTRFNFQ